MAATSFNEETCHKSTVDMNSNVLSKGAETQRQELGNSITKLQENSEGKCNSVSISHEPNNGEEWRKKSSPGKVLPTNTVTDSAGERKVQEKADHSIEEKHKSNHEESNLINNKKLKIDLGEHATTVDKISERRRCFSATVVLRRLNKHEKYEHYATLSHRCQDKHSTDSNGGERPEESTSEEIGMCSPKQRMTNYEKHGLNLNENAAVEDEIKERRHCLAAFVALRRLSQQEKQPNSFSLACESQGRHSTHCNDIQRQQEITSEETDMHKPNHRIVNDEKLRFDAHDQEKAAEKQRCFAAVVVLQKLPEHNIHKSGRHKIDTVQEDKQTKENAEPDGKGSDKGTNVRIAVNTSESACFAGKESANRKPSNTLPKHKTGKQEKKTNLTCKVCDTTFTSSSCLHRHMNHHNGLEKFYCDLCSKSFTRLYNLKTHLQNHTGENPYVCKECKRVFASKSSLKAHLKCHERKKPTSLKPSVEKKKLYRCSRACGATFEDPALLKEHRKSHVTVNQFGCKICKASFRIPYLLKIHMRLHTKEKPYVCKLCSASFRLSQELRSHIKGVHLKLKPHKCDICAAAYRNKGALKDHMRKHTGEKVFKCGECDTSFMWQATWKAHMMKHRGEKIYHCKVCKAAFRDMSNLRHHSQTHIQEKKYFCTVCDASFAKPANLKIHMKVHTGEKPCSCSVCGKRFRDKAKVKEHMRKHTGEKPYACSVCKRKFSDSGNLKKHEEIHSGEKRYSCKTCGAKFRRDEHLKAHLKTHTGEKPYKCDICSAAFRDSKDLRIHKLTHGEDRPFKCTECDRAFKDPRDLRRHKLIHTGERPYRCKECKATFIRSGHLKSHLATHGGEKPFRCPVCDYACRLASNLKVHVEKLHPGRAPFPCRQCSAAFKAYNELKKHVADSHTDESKDAP